MENNFIPYELALALKELGFNEPCFGYYTGDTNHLVIRPNMGRVNEPEHYVITAPLYQQAFKWFREKYNLLATIYSNASGFAWEIHDNIGGTHRFDSSYEGDCAESGMFTSYEKAELACLIKLIELCKKN